MIGDTEKYASKKDSFAKKRRNPLVHCVKIDVRSPAVTVADMRDEGDTRWYKDQIGRTDGGRLHQF